MNIYFLVEGKVTEDIIYKSWIPQINDSYKIVSRIEDVDNNCIFLISGGGYPSYFEKIKSAQKDIIEYDIFDKLIIAVDSEDFTIDEKLKEVDEFIKGESITIDYEILVQHFCIETWFLGNRKIYSANPQNPKLKTYQSIFNVAKKDPELLPEYQTEKLNRSQFASSYLSLLLKEKNKRLVYRKSNPQLMCEKTFFEQLVNRYQNTNHIRSFGKFLDLFSKSVEEK